MPPLAWSWTMQSQSPLRKTALGDWMCGWHRELHGSIASVCAGFFVVHHEGATETGMCGMRQNDVGRGHVMLPKGHRSVIMQDAS